MSSGFDAAGEGLKRLESESPGAELSMDASGGPDSGSCSRERSADSESDSSSMWVERSVISIEE